MILKKLSIKIKLFDTDFTVNISLPENSNYEIIHLFLQRNIFRDYFDLFDREFWNHKKFVIEGKYFPIFNDDLNSILKHFEEDCIILEQMDLIANEAFLDLITNNLWLLKENSRIINLERLKNITSYVFYNIIDLSSYSKKVKIHYIPLMTSFSDLVAYKYISYLTGTWNSNSSTFKKEINYLKNYENVYNKITNEYEAFSNFTIKYKQIQRKLLNKFVKMIQRIPSQNDMNFPHLFQKKILENYLNNSCSIQDIEDSVYLESVNYFIETEGSWFKALVNSKCLENAEKKTKYGTWVIANDGHQCRSIAERNVDDWLSYNKIIHNKEIKYPNSKWVCDWKVKDYYIELFGLSGETNYDIKTDSKIKFAKENDLKLIDLYLNDIFELDKKLNILLE